MKFVLLPVCIMLSSFSFSQNTPQEKLDSFSAKFVTAIRTHERQKIYLSTDRSVYTNGEDIWFRAFLLNAISDKINNSSRFLFVDLVNDKDSVIKTMILDAANKQTDSRMLLPSTLPPGNYWLRAFTRQILQTDPGNICVKPIYVLTRTGDANFKQKQNKTRSPDTAVVVKFYPEGGNIITGASSTVAVSITNSNGIPIQVKGLIRDNYDAVMAGFTTDEYGLAKFDFEPSGHRQYRAVINWNGKEKTFPLPAFNFFGGQISVTKGSPNYTVRVLLGDSIYTKNTLSYLIAISKDNMVFASIGRGLYQVLVPDNKLPDGIVTFYLFDEGFKLLSERSVYVDDNSLHVKLSTDRAVYGRNKKVTMDFSFLDKAHQPVASLVTISVVDSVFSNPDKNCDGGDDLYPAHQLGNIFLATDECFDDKEKDVLMLMRGNNYERLSVPADNAAVVDNDRLLNLTGVVLDEKGLPLAEKIVTLISNSKFLTDTTNGQGRFKLPLDNYPDSTQIAIKVTNLKGRSEKDKVILDNINYPKVKTPASLKDFAAINIPLLQSYIDRYYRLDTSDQHVLPHVYVKDQQEVNYDASKRVSSSSTILTSKDINDRTGGVANALLKVGGLHLLNGYLVVNGLSQMNSAPDQGSEPMILVNGAPVTTSADMQETSPDLAFLNSFDPNNIDFIEIIKGPEGARYGIRGGNGVILVNTKNKTSDFGLNADNLKIFYVPGVAKSALFPIKMDEENETKSFAYVDDKPTLFWSGNYFTDKANNTITFYTGDSRATYIVTVKGISGRGDIIYKTITFSTK